MADEVKRFGFKSAGAKRKVFSTPQKEASPVNTQPNEQQGPPVGGLTRKYASGPMPNVQSSYPASGERLSFKSSGAQRKNTSLPDPIERAAGGSVNGCSGHVTIEQLRKRHGGNV